MKKKIVVVLLIILTGITIVYGKNNNEINSIVWWSIHGAYLYPVNPPEGLGYVNFDFFCEFGLKFSMIDISISFNPGAYLVALVFREDVGIRIFETNDYLLRFFIGIEQVYIGNTYYDIDLGLNFGLSRGESCCFLRGDSRVFTSIYYKCAGIGSSYIMHMACVGVGCRW